MQKKQEKKPEIDKAGFFLSKKAGRAMTDYGMIKDGDRIIVAVSGGRDSLSLLRILKYRQTFVPIKYEIIAVHIDMGHSPLQSGLLRDYFKKNGYKYRIKKSNVLKKEDPSKINCFWCSWNRRKALFELADKLDCTKIALGHHKDDIVETVLLNLFFNGEISAMAPKQELFKGKITLLRPFAYAEKKEIERFSRSEKFPYTKCSCARAKNTQRAKVEAIIKDLARICPQVKTNIFNSIKRIKKDYLL